MSALCVASLGLALVGLASPRCARADVFGPISLVSANPLQQAEYAHDPAISGDGRYVVFDGSIGGVTGVWRREIRSEGEREEPTGELEQVAGGDAELPSVSENGQYISFTTNEGASLAQITDGRPDSDRIEEAPNVYVRDMGKQPGEPGAFKLASNLTYEYPAGGNQATEEKEFGAQAAGRTALSANGQKVVFVTTAVSNLDGPGTPPLQVAVHNVQSDETEIVSVADDPYTGAPAIDKTTGLPEPVPLETEGGTFGAVYSKGGPPAFESPEPYSVARGIGASISADGSTVAWMGEDIGEQALMLPGEASGLRGEYSEPLWRRIGDGQSAPTRRVTGGSDPANPPCAADPRNLAPTPSLSEPCQGPFASGRFGIWNGAASAYVVPQLSGDGEKVAFIASAPLVSQGSDFRVSPETRSTDLYVADMQAGVSRVQALRQLTELGGGEETGVSTDARILDFAISTSGAQVAFSTKRTEFPLGSLTYVSTPAAIPGLAELFDVDLENDTLTRVTHAYLGGPAEHPHAEEEREDPYQEEDDGSLSPSFSTGGTTLAFSSTASNLVYGDGNTPPLHATALDGSDAFVVKRIQFGSVSTPQYISSAPSLSVTPTWSLGVTALSLGNGDVRLYVNVPGPGALTAYVGSRVPTGLAHAPSGSSRGASPRGRIGSRSRVGVRARSRARASVHAGSHARVGATVVSRTVATATAQTSAPGGEVLTLLLKLAPRFRTLAAQKGGLSGKANLIFTAPGHPELRQVVTVSFSSASRHAKTAVRERTVARRGFAGRRGR